MNDIYKISTLRLRQILAVAAIILAFFNIYNNRFYVFGDIITYLDMADNFLQNGWEGLVNGYWSPLYPFILAIVKSTFTIPQYQEIVTMNFFNGFIFIFTLFCFDLFLNQLIKFNKWTTAKVSKEFISLPAWSIIIIGYSIFTWSQIHLTAVWKASPDVLFSGWIYLAYFLLLKIHMGNKNKMMFLYLGLILGLAFFTKQFANIFIGFFLFFIFLTHNKFKEALTYTGITLLAILLLVGPYIYSLSNYKGFFTIGETSKIYYAMFVNNIRQYVHWQGECNPKTTNCEKIGKPKHPTRKIYSNPNTYEFDKFNATVPTWYDISYWYEGARPYFDLKGHLRCFKKYKTRTKKLFLDTNKGLFILISFLLFLSFSKNLKLYISSLRNYLILFIPPTLILTIITFTYTYHRYMGGFLTIFWLSLFSAIRFPSVTDKRLMAKIKITTCIGFLVLLINGYTTIKTTLYQRNHKQFDQHQEVARYLNKIGIKKGNKVARIYRSVRVSWARLARIKIIAEVDSGNGSSFWQAPKHKQTDILKAFNNAGALVVLSPTAPRSKANSDWKRINKTGFYVYDLRRWDSKK